MLYEDQNDPLLEQPLRDVLKNKKVIFGIVSAIAVMTITFYLLTASDSKNESSIVLDVDKENVNTDKVNKEIKEIFVDLSGAVENPGIYKLLNGARVADLIALGGPVLQDASAVWISQNLNLAGLLKDSQKVYIPFEWDFENNNVLVVRAGVIKNNEANIKLDLDSETPDVEAGDGLDPDLTNDPENDGNLINVNQAGQSDLETLNGIGKVYAKRIIDNRPYVDLVDLGAKTGIPISTVDKIKDFISF